eukprot:CAMPEP_0197451764 /NCGR_PEP_ID=MMETSP1175-20131217/30050_1 /TAXON_ID=1003142 /ORGANISM="Triceratium dubium, Strain CCMP147" /LENGTH=43 /DNA_ID= /DNA_START= /DNA_END= /DNA_ORIENTATION=
MAANVGVGGPNFVTTKALRDKRLVHMLLLYLMAHGRKMKVPAI